MQGFTENPLNPAAAPDQIGNDDADSIMGVRGLRLIFQNPARPLGGGPDFTSGIDQAQEYGLAAGLGKFALENLRPALRQAVKQSLLSGRRLEKACKFNLFGDRELSPYDEIRYKCRKFGA